MDWSKFDFHRAAQMDQKERPPWNACEYDELKRSRLGKVKAIADHLHLTSILFDIQWNSDLVVINLIMTNTLIIFLPLNGCVYE